MSGEGWHRLVIYSNP